MVTKLLMTSTKVTSNETGKRTSMHPCGTYNYYMSWPWQLATSSEAKCWTGQYYIFHHFWILERVLNFLQGYSCWEDFGKFCVVRVCTRVLTWSKKIKREQRCYREFEMWLYKPLEKSKVFIHGHGQGYCLCFNNI